jgi:hypothetical protein
VLRVVEAQDVDRIMMVDHGRGGVARQQDVKLGSVVDRVIQESALARITPDPASAASQAR